MSREYTRRGALTVVGTGAAVALAGCTSGGGGTGGGTEVVAVGPDGDLVFDPGTASPLEIDTGTTVRFVWESSGHNIHVDSQPADADWQGHGPIEDEGFELEHTFEVAGEYHYWCQPHKGAGMVGDITVQSGGGGAY